MSTHARPSSSDPVDGRSLRVAVIRARWNADLVDRLLVGVEHGLRSAGVREHDDVTVAGCLELPFAAKVLAETGGVDAIVCVGVVVRGATSHYDVVVQGCATGIQRVQLDTGVPVGFGVLAVDDTAQALERSEPPPGANAGSDATDAALELAVLTRRWSGAARSSRSAAR